MLMHLPESAYRMMPINEASDFEVFTKDSLVALKSDR